MLQRKATCACGGGCPRCQNKLPIQTKLAVSQPGDIYEQEAERVAEHVMRMRVTKQHNCAACSAGAFTCSKCFAEKNSPVQRKLEGRVDDSESVSHSLIQNLGPGQPLDSESRSFFESRFAHDFSEVRVHRDLHAGATARALGAEAFTIDRDIVFAPGRYAPASEAGQRLLAHELTHIIQQRDVQRAGMPYRPKNSANFGVCDGSSMVENSFNMRKDKNTKPWIEKITVNFSGTATDSDGDLVPKGELTAQYFSNRVKPANIKVDIVGGKASEGLTDSGSHTVSRIEGCGYHHTTVPKAERIAKHPRAGKYFKDISKATMNFAVFFVEGPSTGNQAIHEGSLSFGSLACVHVGNRDTIRQINYHSVDGHTVVEVSYGAAALKDLCCERFKVRGFMVSNPCKGQDPKKCP
jgi:hypothetical protein